MPRVTLSPLSVTDEAEFLAAVAGSRRLHRPWVQPPATHAAFLAMVMRMNGPADFGFTVRRAEDDALAGFIGITNIVRGVFHSAYTGYYAFSGFEGQGMMSDGLRLAVRHAFKVMKLHRLEANLQPGNEASRRLVQACGFQREGYSPRYLKIGGRWRDHERWARLADG